MRILLLTDSLGCPRAETPVSNTWTDKILNKWSSQNIVFYTYCVHGLSASKIDLDYLQEISPDVIIMQIGIVDACRRALGRYEQEIISRIPGVRTIVRIICRRYHYLLTMLRNIHDCSPRKFLSILNMIQKNSAGVIYFIKIAPAGKIMLKKVFHIKKDIQTYNSIVQSVPKIKIIDPYDNKDPESLFLSDGHHLNALGNDLLFFKVNEIICSELNLKRIKKGD